MVAISKLCKEGADVNAKDEHGRNALMFAAAVGNLAAIKYFIKRGADVNEKDNDGWTAVMKAAIRGHKEAVALLCQYGADVNAKDNNGKTVFDDKYLSPEMRNYLNSPWDSPEKREVSDRLIDKMIACKQMFDQIN